MFALLLAGALVVSSPHCHRIPKRPTPELWGGTIGARNSTVVWCVIRTLVPPPFFTEAMGGRIRCIGKHCPLRRGWIAALVQNEADVLSPYPEGTQVFAGTLRSGRKHCDIRGTGMSGVLFSGSYTCPHGKDTITAAFTFLLIP